MAEEEPIDHSEFDSWDCVGAVGLLAAFPPVLQFVCYEVEAGHRAVMEQGIVFGAVLAGVIGLTFVVSYVYQFLFSSERFTVFGSFGLLWRHRATLLVNSVMAGCVAAELVCRMFVYKGAKSDVLLYLELGIVAVYVVYLLTFFVKSALMSKIVNLSGIVLAVIYVWQGWIGVQYKFERDMLSAPTADEKAAVDKATK